MDKYIKIDGGFGRCIAATGAIKEYAKNSKDKVFVVTSFPQVFSGIEEIARVYPQDTPYLYEEHISKGEFFEPEPYNNVSYYAEEKHLATVFNKLLNGKDEYIEPLLVMTDNELESAKQFVEEVHKTGKKIVLYQPWGSSGGKPINNAPEPGIAQDESYRSFGTEFAKKLCSRLQTENYEVYVVKTGDQLGFKDAKTFQNMDVRKICALIPYVDAIICCDSFLHHASAALGSPVPTIVLWAGTNEKNLSYPNQINIKSWKKTENEPNRIPHDHDYYVHKNKGSNEFKLETIDTILEALKGKTLNTGLDNKDK